MSAGVRRLKGWTPLRFYWQDGRACVDWCYLGDEPLTDPFYQQTVERALSDPCNLLFRHQTPIEALGELAEVEPGLPPTGFIFHVSRCGSTLVAQMLAALAQHLVVSEAAPLDGVLRAHFREQRLTEERRAEWLRWMVSALGRPRRGVERHYFIKFDCWSALALPVVRRAFPDVPWIFLYREPAEVIVSQLRRRGAHMIPGAIEPALFGMTPAEVFELAPADYMARVLGEVCAAALRHADDAALLLNYRQLPEAVLTVLPAHWGLRFDEAELERMRRASARNAKNPVLAFTDDTAEKASAVTEQVQRASARWAEPLHRQLEEARAARHALRG